MVILYGYMFFNGKLIHIHTIKIIYYMELQLHAEIRRITIYLHIILYVYQYNQSQT